MKGGIKHLTQEMILSIFKKAARQNDSIFYNKALNVDCEPELLTGGVLNQVYKV